MGNIKNEPGLRTTVFQPCCIITDILSFEEIRGDGKDLGTEKLMIQTKGKPQHTLTNN